MERTIEFPQMIARGCGLDVHRSSVVATIMGQGITTETRIFSTFSSDLRSLSKWLGSHDIEQVAMESTGVYWKPIFNILEDDFEVILVNARHIKNVPGHKTDKKDSAWIAKLLLSGLLKASFIPPEAVRDLRDLLRYKRKQVGRRSAEKNRLHKILEDANLKMGNVMSDVFGVSGMAMVRAIRDGVTDPEQLANMAKGSLRKKKAELKEALDGKIREHHRFMLALILETIKKIDETIAVIEARIDEVMEPFGQESELLQTIPGVSKETAQGIISETGVDMEKFPDQAHLASWAGICPGNNESAGKQYSAQTPKGNKHLRTILTEAGWAAAHTKDTYLNERYNTLAPKRGRKRAIIALGHKILVAAYFILRDKICYSEQEYEKQKMLRNERKIAHNLAWLTKQGLQVQVSRAA